MAFNPYKGSENTHKSYNDLKRILCPCRGILGAQATLRAKASPYRDSGSYIKPDVIYRAMCDLEMDILIIVIHMFLSFFKMPFDGSKFFAVSEIKQSCGVKRMPKT